MCLQVVVVPSIAPFVEAETLGIRYALCAVDSLKSPCGGHQEPNKRHDFALKPGKSKSL